MKAQLLKTRRLLKQNGWVGPQLEPWCRDSRGRAVHHADEGVQTFSLGGALQLAGAELEGAFVFLGRVVSPELARLEDLVARYTLDELHAMPVVEYAELDWTWRQLLHAAGGTYLTFGGWLVQADRTLDDLLRVLATAVLRSAREKCT